MPSFEEKNNKNVQKEHAKRSAIVDWGFFWGG